MGAGGNLGNTVTALVPSYTHTTKEQEKGIFHVKLYSNNTLCLNK